MPDSDQKREENLCDFTSTVSKTPMFCVSRRSIDYPLIQPSTFKLIFYDEISVKINLMSFPRWETPGRSNILPVTRFSQGSGFFVSGECSDWAWDARDRAAAVCASGIFPVQAGRNCVDSGHSSTGSVHSPSQHGRLRLDGPHCLRKYKSSLQLKGALSIPPKLIESR